MGRKIRPYKRKKGSPKQKLELNSLNYFTDILASAYDKNTNSENKKDRIKK